MTSGNLAEIGAEDARFWHDSLISQLQDVARAGSLDNDTWAELDNLLKKRWRHPSGGVVKIDACVIDGSDGGVFDRVLSFSGPRVSRKILCGKGVDGFARPALTMSKSKRGRFFLIGVDSIKT